jgi:hypothetical protein
MKAWRNVSWDVGMPFLVSLVFLNKVEIVPSDYDCTVQLDTVACTSQDTTSNGHASNEGALLVNVSSFNSFSGDLETKANTLPVAVSTFPRSLSLSRFLRAKENLRLLEESFLGLLRHGYEERRSATSWRG